MADPVTLFIIPALIMGGVIGLIEIFFVHADESHMGWFTHALHAIPFTILFVFISMNISWVFAKVGHPITENMWFDLGVRTVITILAMLKISAAAAVAGRVGEKVNHILIIGALIFAAPYIWDFVGPSLVAQFPVLKLKL